MERVLNWIGLGLLALCFVASLGRIAWKNLGGVSDDGKEVIEIRLAHWQLEGGIRESLDVLAREYMDRNPHVRIIQIPIPERIYKNWLLTQLVGGTAPDIIQIGIGITDERLARFFIPLTQIAEAPNPYNAGNEHEGVPLRETFIDGMVGGFNASLLEYYGVPLSAYTIRVYINMDLLREITGSETLPRTYREFIELCRKTLMYGEEKGQTIFPVAGSRYNSPFLMRNLFSSQTQRLTRELGPPGSFEILPNRLAETYADEDWTLDSPEIRSGLRIMREVGQMMQPGFMQVTRDDASFYFMQGRALMIATGSWDSSSISSQARFPFRAFRIPLPGRDDPEFGEFVMGFTSEAGTNSGMSFGVTNTSAHQDIATDFLLFLASQPMNQKFADVSGSIPSVVGVVPSELTTDFMILTDGYTPGLNLIYNSWPDTSRVFNNAFHRLVAHEGSIEEFVEIIRPEYAKAQLSDLEREALKLKANLQRMDIQLAGTSGLADWDPDDPGTARRLDLIISSANMQDQRMHNLGHVMKKVQRRIKEDSD